MTWLPTLSFMIGFSALLISAHHLWVWRSIRFHPHVEPLEIACPGIANELQELNMELARLSKIEPPLLFVRRAQLPNAFVIATILRPEIYLSDDLLEEASSMKNGVDYLIRILCHEFAHIQNNDTYSYFFWTYGENLSDWLKLSLIKRYCHHRLHVVEKNASKHALILYQRATRT